MIHPPSHPNEARRLRVLDSLSLTDTPADKHLDAIVSLARRLFSVEVAYIALVGEDRQWFLARTGMEESATPRDVSFCGHAILGEDALIVEDASADPRFMNNPAVTGDSHVRFYVGQPLFVEGQPIGTLCLVDPKSRKINDVELLNLKDLATLAEGYISMRAQSAQITELRQVLSNEQRRAMLDPLTQTWNRLGLQRLVEAWRPGAAGRYSIGIAYCDLDHFKSINDRYGHAVGDKVLRSAARSLTEAMREGDIIGRLGGEEFVVLLRLENVTELPAIADRLRQVVEMPNETGIAQTMSVGTAIMDAHETFDQALHRADQAMYQAKQAGRNRVVEAQPISDTDGALQ